MSQLVHKFVAITGASSGIGEETARRLGAAGAKLVIGARGNNRLQALAGVLEEQGIQVAHLATDVRRREDLLRLVELAQERFGRLDVLVSNAGVGPIAPLDDLRVEEWETTIDVNIEGVLYEIAVALPVFRAQGCGHFVNVASTAAHRITPNMAVYAASKFAVRTISEGLRQEAGDKLRVTVISPGFTIINLPTRSPTPSSRLNSTRAWTSLPWHRTQSREP